MKVIDIYPPINKGNFVPVVLTLGFFDGVHLAHQKIIQFAKKISKSKGIPLAVMTLVPHPDVIYKNVPKNKYIYLSTRKRKIELMRKMGVDILYFVHFTKKFIKLTPYEFVNDFLVVLNPKIVIAGFDYTFGDHKIANMKLLYKLSSDRFNVIEIPCLKINNKKISSSLIRKLISSGQIDTANKYLGYPYENSGKIIHGYQRGRKLGFPTVNVKIDAQQQIPGIGIYAVEVIIDNKYYYGVCSVGHNVTFGNFLPLSVEIYIFNYSGNLYDKKIKILWFHYLRNEVKFDNINSLIKQMKMDVKETKDFFNLLKNKRNEIL